MLTPTVPGPGTAGATGHAVLRKRDVRAAVAWVGLVWLVPRVGVVLYLLLGINRIRRRGRSLALRQEHGQFPPRTDVAACTPGELAAAAPAAAHLASLARLVDEVVHHRPLLPGNELVPRARPLPIRLRDGVARLLSPYL